jgi:hypothetical protein
MTPRIPRGFGLTTYTMNSQLFVQKYQLYLPDRESLRRELELGIRQATE